MTKRQVDLIPKKVSEELNAILRPLNPVACDAAIRFLADEITQMFRELSEHRSSTEGKARQVLSRRELRVLRKIEELFPDEQSVIEDAYKLMIEVLEQQFNRQRGRKYL